MKMSCFLQLRFPPLWGPEEAKIKWDMEVPKLSSHLVGANKKWGISRYGFLMIFGSTDWPINIDGRFFVVQLLREIWRQASPGSKLLIHTERWYGSVPDIIQIGMVDMVAKTFLLELVYWTWIQEFEPVPHCWWTFAILYQLVQGSSTVLYCSCYLLGFNHPAETLWNSIAGKS